MPWFIGSRPATPAVSAAESPYRRSQSLAHVACRRWSRDDPGDAVVEAHRRASMGIVPEIDAGRLVLRPIEIETARALLEGRTPTELVLAKDYPSQFSLEVMDLLAGPRSQALHHFGPFFMIRKKDAAVIGEIGALLDLATRTAQVGYSVVASCSGHGMPRRHSGLFFVRCPDATT